MRTIIGLAICFSTLLHLGCGQQTAEIPAVEINTVFNEAGLPTTELNVPGLHCEACQARATELLETADGVEDFNIDLSSKTVIIAYNTDSFDNDSLIKIFNDGNFPEALIVVKSVGKSSSPLEVIEEPTAEEAN